VRKLIFDRAIRNITNSTDLVQTPMTLSDPTEWLTGVTTGTTQSGAMKLSAVNACVEVITNSISKLPIFIMDRNTKEHI
jgi:phage portal protein BeeE